MPDLKSPPLQREPAALEQHADVLAAAQQRDILFHRVRSFQPVVEMIRQAARDPDVVHIALTLCRTDRESPVVHALLDAVRQGKQVRVLVELDARLDEHRNVNWWHMLEQAGASVFPSPAGLKVHAKMALIERHEAGRLRRYAPVVGQLQRIHRQSLPGPCTSHVRRGRYSRVASLFDALCVDARPRPVSRADGRANQHARRVDGAHRTEIACHRRGERGHIILKMNGLVDRDVIRLLYRASQEGVYVDLLVRSLCCLRPGVAGVSERMRSKHRRPLPRAQPCLVFPKRRERRGVHRQRGPDASESRSARRGDGAVEGRRSCGAPVRDSASVLADNVKARELRADGSYVRPGANR